MKKQRKTILLTINGKFEHKGSISMERKITGATMARIITVVAEDEMREQEEKKFQREIKKQQNIINSIN